jgi:hypothetical protein
MDVARIISVETVSASIVSKRWGGGGPEMLFYKLRFNPFNNFLTYRFTVAGLYLEMYATP